MNDVVSIELAQKLKETGYPQESTKFIWHSQGKEFIMARPLFEPEERSDYNVPYCKGHDLAAPSTGELLEKLPDQILYSNSVYHLKLGKTDGYYIYYHTVEEEPRDAVVFESNSSTDVCGMMWLWLKREGYFK